MKTRFLLPLLLSAVALPAQTVVWIAQGNLATIDDWNTPAYWSTGVVPNGSSFAAVINQVTPANRNIPNGPYTNPIGQAPASVAGGALPVITGPLTLGQLRFDVSTAVFGNRGAVYIGSPVDGTPGFLVLDGNGFGSSSIIDLNVTSGSSLTFTNRGSLSSGGTGLARLTVFLGETTAAASNPARLTFRDDTAIATFDRRITVQGVGPAAIVFAERSRAGNGDLLLAPNSTVEFHNTASADAALIRLSNNSQLLFDGQSTAASASIVIASTGAINTSTAIRWAGQSSLGSSSVTSLTGSHYGSVEISDQAVANGNSITTRLLDITGAATAGGATGRQRTLSSVLPATSVVATDARTITLGAVNATDVIIGSNTLEVASGLIFNLRDSGGAFLSASGENLVGGTLVKTGSGSLTLAAPITDPTNGNQPSYNVFSGPTLVRGGSLFLHNRLASVTVESGGTIGGGGIVAGRLTNQGLVRPESTILRVNGDYVQSAGGTFYPYFAYTPGQPTTYGLAIGGSATLAGRLVAATHPNMFTNWAPGVVQLQVLSAAAINGRFDTLETSSNPARIAVTASYAPTTVTLRFEMRPFVALGTTPAGTAFGAYLDRVFAAPAFFPNNYNWIGSALTFESSPVKAAQTMDDLSPDRYGIVPGEAFAAAAARRTSLDRVTGGNQALPAAGRGRFFAEGSRRQLDFTAVNDLPAGDSSTTGWLAGGQRRWGDWIAGAYLASERTDLQDEAGTAAKIRGDEIGLFARFDHGPWFVHAAAGRVTGRHDLRRFVQFNAQGAVDVVHTASADGDRTDLSLTAGHTWRGRTWSLSPFAGFLLSRWQLDNFTETSDRTIPHDSLAITDWSHDSRRARAGLEASASFWGGRVQPRLTAAWWHELDADRPIPAALVGAPSGYLAPGRPADEDSWQASLDVAIRLRSRLWFTAGSSLQRGDLTRTKSDVTLGLAWEF